ncbi:MAG TPA: heterodisulfide reductase-related iron-sulfur binding cluster [Candidatus Binatus sp.]|uniref:(Fe-S)-binding protein n=1 Tax=Candidatus Binatus sp. TaxID=2811406 RepID=UPI002B47A45C|nr:heterodisulfide reductase-related iron-sulfur binding cluster [Candidatus Binatus sp.]HKN13731.1 heterodisulfide reductase-related iron-sulfur binding cluster [Candidatus Binatus sp.]
MAEADVTSSNPVRDICDYDLLFDCVHCGLCAEACPTYVVTRSEMDSPRGRIYLMKSIAEGRIDLDADAARHLDLCLGCRGCETACPSGVHYGRLIEGARSFVERHHRRDVVDRFKRRAVGAIFPYPNRLRALLTPLKVADRLGLRPALRAITPRVIRDWLDLLPPLEHDSRPLAGEATIAPRKDAPTVVVHHGCVAQVLANSETLNSERLLGAAGYRVVQLEPTTCCGALDLHSGNASRARDFARANVRALKNSGADAIVSAASGCSVAIAEYGGLLEDEPEFAEQARAISSKVRDLSSLLLDAPASSKREFQCRVTYHDACHLAHGLGVREAPRKLLASIPGVTLIEMTESDLCCGSAGSYNLTEPAMARELARRKADNIVAIGADCVVLANPGCEFQIAAELRRRNSKIKVVHLANFLAMASQ